MEGKLGYKLEQLNSAIDDFSRSLKIDLTVLTDEIADVVMSGQVQKFEFTVELFWKVVKLFLEEVHGFDEKSPKSVMKRFFLLEYISQDDYEALVDSLNDRNRLSHIYNKKQFGEIYESIAGYADLFRRTVEKL